MLIKPKEIQIEGRTYIISKIPATKAVEIMAKSVLGAIPTAREYPLLEAMMIETMEYVAIKHPNLGELRLNSKVLIDNHCLDAEGNPSYQVYLKILDEISEYNTFFFHNGRPSIFLKNLIQALPEKIIKIFSPSSPVSSLAESLDTTN